MHQLSIILAPFTPFLAEELYHKLGGKSESVHLIDWPTSYTVDQVVLDEMEAVREYVNQALSVRAKSRLKIRQPLASVTVPSVGTVVDFESIVLEELNVKKVIQGDELALDLELTPELKREGLMREIVRHVQSARKAAGLNVDDRIVLVLATEDVEVQTAIDEYRGVIDTETLAVSGQVGDDGYTTDVKVEGAVLTVSLAKREQ